MVTNSSAYQRWWRSRNWQTTYQAKLKNYRQTEGAPRTGATWTTDEDNAITAPGHPSDRELSSMLGRSMHAIQNRRSLLNKRAES